MIQTLREIHRTAIRTVLASIVLFIASCASKKSAVTDASRPDRKPSTETRQPAEVQQLTFIQKVSDNQVYAKDIVGNMSFTLQTGSKNINVPGSLHMRKDEVIRIQLFIPLLGSEVGRLEFTPEHVLLVDRIHKEYIQADYSQVDFLNENGINFYSLQALFWNQLLIPGQKSVSESDLKKFSADLNAAGPNTPISLNSGNMTYRWSADKTTGRIDETDIAYRSATRGTSSLNWKYDNFTPVGVKSFPARQTFRFTTSATKQSRTVTVTIKMNDVKTTSKWDATTTISPRYKKISADDILKKLINF